MRDRDLHMSCRSWDGSTRGIYCEHTRCATQKTRADGGRPFARPNNLRSHHMTVHGGDIPDHSVLHHIERPRHVDQWCQYEGCPDGRNLGGGASSLR